MKEFRDRSDFRSTRTLSARLILLDYVCCATYDRSQVAFESIFGHRVLQFVNSDTFKKGARQVPLLWYISLARGDPESTGGFLWDRMSRISPSESKVKKLST